MVGGCVGVCWAGSGLVKRWLYWRISRWTVRRFLLRDGYVMAAAGMHPPWPPLLKGGKVGGPLLTVGVLAALLLTVGKGGPSF